MNEAQAGKRIRVADSYLIQNRKGYRVLVRKSTVDRWKAEARAAIEERKTPSAAALVEERRQRKLSRKVRARAKKKAKKKEQ